MATKSIDEVKAEVEAGLEAIASSLEQDYYGGTATTVTDATAGTTDNTVHVPHMTTGGGGSAGQIWIQDGTGTSPGDVYITDGSGNDFSLSGAWDNNADLTIGNLKIMVKDNGEMTVILDDVEYHFSKNKVKSFLEKFADAKVG